MNHKQRITDLVIEQIKKDINGSGDITAIDELLKKLPVNNLLSYLPEDVSNQIVIGTTKLIEYPKGQVEYYIEDNQGEMLDFSDDFDYMKEKFELSKLSENDIRLVGCIVIEDETGQRNTIDSEVLDSHWIDDIPQ